MGKQTLKQRVERIIADIAKDATTDARGRWNKVVEDGIAESALEQLGPMPSPTLEDIPKTTAVEYAAADADATLRIYPILHQRICDMGLGRALALDLAVIPMVAAMTQNGLLVDTGHLAVLAEVLDDNLWDVEHRTWDAAGRRFNIGSGDQVAEVLYDDLGLGDRTTKRTKSRKRYATDEKALSALKGRHPVVALIQEHRELSKLKSSYVDTLPKLISPDGRWRYELGMATVPSGRLNGWGGVNPLAIPVRSELGREIRRCFIAPPGYKLCSIDLNQVELRALAILSKDPVMLGAFRDGKDLHRLTASSLFRVPFESVTFEQRQRGKTINFAIANQISAPGLLDQYVVSGIANVTVNDADADLKAWFELYAQVPKWFESVYSEGRLNGYIRDVLSGRILYCPGLRSPIEKVESEARRVCSNWEIQTFAQVLLKLGMAALWPMLEPLGIKPLLQIHDEILLEVPDEHVDILPGLAEVVTSAAPPLPIPILASCNHAMTWADLK